METVQTIGAVIVTVAAIVIAISALIYEGNVIANPKLKYHTEFKDLTPGEQYLKIASAIVTVIVTFAHVISLGVFDSLTFD